MDSPVATLVMFVVLFAIIYSVIRGVSRDGGSDEVLPADETPPGGDGSEGSETVSDGDEPDLITCPACNESVSEQASACIHCGHPLDAEYGERPAPSSTADPDDKLDPYLVRALRQDFTDREIYQQKAANWSAIGILIATFLGLISGSGLILGIVGGLICLGAGLANKRLGGKYFAFLVPMIFVYTLAGGAALYALGVGFLQQIGGVG